MSSEQHAPDDLRRLLDLQRLDSTVRRLRHQLDNLEEQQRFEAARGRDRSLREQQDERRVDLERIQAEQRRVEGELDLLRQRRDAEQARMYGGGISNPKELQSLRAEIESTERRIDDHETGLLEAMERSEGLEGEIADLQRQRDELAGELERLATRRDEAAQGLLAELAEHEVDRDRLREGLSDDLLRRYDAAAERFGGIAVGALRDGMCTACRLELPVVDQNELLEGPPLATCPHCRRLLVVVD